MKRVKTSEVNDEEVEEVASGLWKRDGVGVVLVVLVLGVIMPALWGVGRVFDLDGVGRVIDLEGVSGGFGVRSLVWSSQGNCLFPVVAGVA